MPRTAELSRLPTQPKPADDFEGDRNDVDDTAGWLLRNKQLIAAGVIFNESRMRRRRVFRRSRATATGNC